MATQRKRLPPLNTIAAFEASARLMSFTRAAEELHLSQGAVSRQIQVLEERMGVTLFNRRHKEIQLTRAGLIFQQAIAQSLNSIRRAVTMIEALDTSTVTIAASNAMASFWLMPAIIDFRSQHPDIDIRVLASNSPVDPWQDPVDLAIRYGDGHWPNVTKVKLFEEEIFPVCAPAYQRGHKIESTEDLLTCELIELDSSISAFNSWDTWFEEAGVQPGVLHKNLTVSNYDLVYRAACSGKGVALAWSYGIPHEARETLLVKPLDISIKTGLSEYIIYTENEELSSPARIFLDWLIDFGKRSIWS
ncbi:bacterial regulatory helix-turn-helix, lysR family protein [Burkholderia gladioli]|uniref:Bacterial regulatory helix-turn-helix, lysR family protein n=2 Tax=Burkholderia gladioli TaxID=28095 RepID=A0AAW3ETA5_BURGA|nr:LysR substrate-binding domain-containing protein [Burkholderia gladioli]AJW97534.1 bacterial regulatory helix-turn-helix, lysR family protein [Burkholderia gladioli]KGC10900.1 bacterial regulatory helix-turn-helix, lysR family protein [Burkholderia gladioli]QPQ84225.1 LysR family transcriptional regulator [Burkholderia gladioli]